jgi:hypothetical protein
MPFRIKACLGGGWVCWPPLLIVVRATGGPRLTRRFRAGINVVDKSRYRDPPRWPQKRTAVQRPLDSLLRRIRAAMPYVLLAIGICGMLYAYHTFSSHPVQYQRRY